MPLQLTGLVHYNAATPLLPRPQTEFDLGAIVTSAQAQETAGFDRVLIANNALMPDCHTIGAHVAANTKTLKLMLAHRPGFIAPTMAARMLATIDQLSGGRAGVHIIAGPNDTELEADGDFLNKAERHHRALEYVEIMRRLWASETPIDHHGTYYRFNQACVPVKPLQRPAIPVFWGGTSDLAIDYCGRCADIYALSGDTLGNVRVAVDRGRAAATRHGRALGFMITLIVILGATEAEAWERADAVLEEYRLSKNAAPTVRNFEGKNDERDRKVAAVEAGLRQDRCLWLGMTKATGGRQGNQTTLVGTAEQVTEALMDYYDLGVHNFLLRGYRPADDIAEYGRLLIPLLRERVADYDRRINRQ